jgi:hypothetical protein
MRLVRDDIARHVDQLVAELATEPASSGPIGD